MNHRRSDRTLGTSGAQGMRIRIGATVLALALVAAGCELDLANPNAPTEEEVLSDVDGIISLGVGMQDQYAGSIHTYIRAPALVTDEWGLKPAALFCDELLLTGEGNTQLSTCGNVSGPYTVTYRVIRSANRLIENAPNIERLSPATRTGIVAVAELFKAMALGGAILNFEQVAVDADPEGSPVQPRDAVLEQIISLLESARARLQGVSDADLGTLRSRVLASGIHLRGTIDAMLARYYLIDGQYQQAIDAADRVDPTVLSAFEYSSTDVNPIWNYSVAANYTAGLRSFVDDAESGDQRPAFWVVTDPDQTEVGQPDSLITPLAQYTTRHDPYPVYLPDEMKLIKAEAYTRLNNLAAARTLVNEVRTQAESSVEEPVANLPALTDEELATADDLLRQIAYERRYELYMQGLRWEDMRRLGSYIDHAPTLEYLPFPDAECQRNPQVSC